MAKPIADRFWSHVERGDEGCWEWQGGRRLAGHQSEKGYGYFWLNNGYVRAHRMAWELTNGPIPDDMVVCHKCDNPPCVRPDHLFLGTHGDNHRDAMVKGRLGNALKTHCRKGHALPEGMGKCEICHQFKELKPRIRLRVRRSTK